MKKILLFTNGKDGVSYHRLITPYFYLQEKYPDEFKVDLFNFNGNSEEEVNKIKEYDFFIYSRIINPELTKWIKSNTNTKIICDIDDYWNLSTTHPLYYNYKTKDMPAKLLESIKQTDYITTTTEFLKSKILTYNTNVEIFPNAVNFLPDKHNTSGSRIRFGIIGGSSHTKDMELLEGVVNQLPNDIKDKVQFVLCGFDGGKTTIYDNGKPKVIDTPWKNTCWYLWERNLTDNFNTISPEHKEFLHRFEKVSYTTKEAYRRIWTLPVEEYNKMYDEVDVLLVPLVDNEFNRCKSPLKLAEAAAKDVAVIVSDTQPYSDYLEDGVNCIAVNNRKKVKGWVKAITKLARQPELISTLANNLKITADKYFNLDRITEERKKWLYEIQ